MRVLPLFIQMRPGGGGEEWGQLWAHLLFLCTDSSFLGQCVIFESGLGPFESWCQFQDAELVLSWTEHSLCFLGHMYQNGSKGNQREGSGRLWCLYTVTPS